MDRLFLKRPETEGRSFEDLCTKDFFFLKPLLLKIFVRSALIFFKTSYITRIRIHSNFE
jgi:hypothetical protein